MQGKGRGKDAYVWMTSIQSSTEPSRMPEEAVRPALAMNCAISISIVHHHHVWSRRSSITYRINLAKLSNNILDQLLTALIAGNVQVVRLALDAVALADFLGVLLAALLTACVGDGYGGAHFGAAASSFDAHAAGAGSAGDDDDFALEGEEVEEVLGFGDGDGHFAWWCGGRGGGGGYLRFVSCVLEGAEGAEEGDGSGMEEEEEETNLVFELGESRRRRDEMLLLILVGMCAVYEKISKAEVRGSRLSFEEGQSPSPTPISIVIIEHALVGCSDING